jgi:hypothetical protein
MQRRTRVAARSERHERLHALRAFGMERGGAPPRLSDASGRNGRSAGSAAAPSDDGINIAQLAAGLSLCELHDDAGLDRLSRRVFAEHDHQAAVERFITHVAGVVTSALHTDREGLVQVLYGFEAKVDALAAGVGNAGIPAMLTRLQDHLDSRDVALTGLRGEIAGIAERLAAWPPPPVAVVDIETVLAAIGEVKKHLAGLVRLLSQKL